MKYANIIYNNRNGRLTIGDDFQILAIENLYRHMGIESNQIVRIEYTDLYTYDGEYLVVPISFPLIGYNSLLQITCFSEKIIPVFLGLCILTENLGYDDVDYLLKHSPIGCRDERTFNTMQKYNIPAYINGCMTLTLDRKTRDEKAMTKIFCVDIPDDFIEYIPDSIKKDCEFTSHCYYMNELECSPEEKTIQIYNKYLNEAKMVITTRMHAALPCIAAGIPVIFIKDIYSYRFVGIDRVAKIYTKNEYKEINWNPQPIEYEALKNDLLELSILRVKTAFDISEKLESFQKKMKKSSEKKWFVEFMDNTFEYINQNWDKDSEINYVLWGITQTADIVYNYIAEHYPLAKLVAVIDRNKKNKFHHIIPCNKNSIELSKDVTIFICTGAAIAEAKKYCIDKKINNYYLCCSDNINL